MFMCKLNSEVRIFYYLN